MCALAFTFQRAERYKYVTSLVSTFRYNIDTAFLRDVLRNNLITTDLTAMNASPLNKLPIELRYSIYESALGGDAPLTIGYNVQQSTASIGFTENLSLGTGLLAACKQIRAEIEDCGALHVLYTLE